MKQLFVGLFTEGTTDVQFLESIVQRTIEQVAFECTGQIETELKIIKIDKTGKDFVTQVLSASKKGMDDYGITLLCVQTDADQASLEPTYKNKIIPAQDKLSQQNEHDYCKVLAAIVPIQEVEAWMLADKSLLKIQIGTTKSDADLGIHRPPESIANPKEVIEAAIRIERQDLTKRRRKNLSIAELYLPIGQAMDLKTLATLPSYNNFQENIRAAFRTLHLLH
ncbi:MAG: hypothetical protein RLZZ292_2419 [Bacteroidota bacterium]|jgi:hypothetical protein